jgi:cyclopropane fatty-acyl-phospholipid synthase-like methyltransferase
VENGVFSNTEEAETYLCGGQRCYKEHVAFLTCRLLNAVPKTAETIIRNNPQFRQNWFDLTDQEVMKLFRGQYPGSLQAGKELAEKIDLSYAKRILDCAGGSGGLAVGLCESFRDITITVADLPEMISFTQKFVSKAGMADRITVIAADILRCTPAGQYDAAIVRSFIQVLSPENAEKAIQHIGKALVPGAMISIVGHFLDDTRLFPLESVVHNLLFLNVYEDGCAYTESEYRQWLRSAGFEDIRVEHSVFSEGAGLITARKA